MQAPLWIIAGLSAAVAGMAALADRRRTRRRDLDRVGWMPWPLILILALMLSLICVAIALKGN